MIGGALICATFGDIWRLLATYLFLFFIVCRPR
jgi:hypothetical protein